MSSKTDNRENSMSKNQFIAFYLVGDGSAKPVELGQELSTVTDGDVWYFHGVYHPRKATVTYKEDPDGPDYWPNLTTRDFYASVLNLGIWDSKNKAWSFRPDWAKDDENPEIQEKGSKLEDFGLIHPNS